MQMFCQIVSTSVGCQGDNPSKVTAMIIVNMETINSGGWESCGHLHLNWILEVQQSKNECLFAQYFHLLRITHMIGLSPLQIVMRQ